MRNSDMFQAIVDQIEEIVGIEGKDDPTIPLWHILAAAHDWCAVKGISFDVTLEEVREQLAQEAS